MQEGLGKVIIDEVLKFLKEEELRVCLCKKTDDVLVLQFVLGDVMTYRKVHEFIDTYEMDIRSNQDEQVERINLFIGDERICTITLDAGGILAWEIDRNTGLMVKPEHMHSGQVPKLRLPSADYLSEYYEACTEFYKLGLYHYSMNPNTYSEWRGTFLSQLDDEAEGKVEGKVPTQTFWLIHNETYIGSVRLRKKLTAELWETYGCAINMEVRPSMWHRGYAKLMFALALQKARSMGIDMLLVGVDASVAAQLKIIEKNGGILLTPGKEDRRYVVPTFFEREVDYSRFL